MDENQVKTVLSDGRECAPFDQWAILEVMGHQTYAGRVTEHTLGGASFVRIDVPDSGKQAAFSKLFSAQAIYCISPVSENIARLRARSLGHVPMTAYDLPRDVRVKLRQLRISRVGPDKETGEETYEEDDDGGF